MDLTERNEALRTLDMDWARRNMPNASGDDVRLAAMHKARHACTGVAMHLRQESADWLREHGMQGLSGAPLDDFS